MRNTTGGAPRRKADVRNLRQRILKNALGAARAHTYMAGIATMPKVAKAGGHGMKAHVVYFALSVAVLTLAGLIHFVTRLP